MYSAIAILCVSTSMLVILSLYRDSYIKSLDPFRGVVCLCCSQELPNMPLFYLLPDDHGVIEIVCTCCNTHNYHKDGKYSLTHPLTDESSKEPLVLFFCSYIDSKESALRMLMLFSFAIMLVSGVFTAFLIF